MDYYVVFERRTILFLDFLSPLLHDVKEFHIMKSYLNMMTNLDNKSILYNTIMNVISPYKNFIINKNDTIFFNNINSSNNIISLLRNKWNDLCESDKNEVWENLIVLIQISDKI